MEIFILISDKLTSNWVLHQFRRKFIGICSCNCGQFVAMLLREEKVLRFKLDYSVDKSVKNVLVLHCSPNKHFTPIK